MGKITFPDVFGCEFDLADRMLGTISGERSDLELVRPRCDYIEVV